MGLESCEQMLAVRAKWESRCGGGGVACESQLHISSSSLALAGHSVLTP